MTQKRKPYESPDMTEIRVELESSICSGSVEFGDEKRTVDIVDQGVNDDLKNNDFSGQEWGVID